MYRTALAVSHTLDIDQLLQRILELIFEWVEADRGCIMLMEPTTKSLQPKAHRTRKGLRADQPITIHDIVHAMGGRSFGVLLFVWAILSVIPAVVPGMSTILGLPLLFLSWQLAWGLSEPWIPKRIAARHIERATIEKLEHGARRFRPIERMLRPRLEFLVTGIGQRLLDRSGRRVTLTDAGRVVDAHARRMLALEDELMREVSGLSDHLFEAGHALPGGAPSLEAAVKAAREAAEAHADHPLNRARTPQPGEPE